MVSNCFFAITREDTMKKNAHEILEQLRKYIFSNDFKNKHRSSVKNFNRQTLLSFPVLIIFILSMIRRSLQSELNSFVKTSLTLPSISKQVFSAARKKILASAFLELNNKLIDEYYNDGLFKTYLGFRLIVVDGSTLQLPESDPIKEKYGVCSNQNSSSTMPMSRISFAYDPLSGLTLDPIISPYTTGERYMLLEHIVNIKTTNYAKDLYLTDRGYPSLFHIFFMIFNNKDFVMRSSTAWIQEVKDVLKSGKNDVIIEINPRMLKGANRKEFKKFFPDKCLKTKIQLRVLVIPLSTGELEILITSLIDKEKYKYEIFKDLYHIRWSGEENYKFHKVRVEIENFSSILTNGIEQDFHATVFTGNIRAILAEEAGEELKLEQTIIEKELKYDYKINKNISISILKNRIVEGLLNPEIDLKILCENIKKEMKKSTIPIRLGRNFKRRRKNNTKYPMNRRRAL